jgi:plastocyanin
MKKILLLFFTTTSLALSAQTTHNLDWSFNSADQDTTIEVGDTVEWTWSGSGTHNLLRLTGPETGFGVDATRYPSGHVYSYTFTTVGVNTYECSPHPDSMYGTITVTSTAGISENNLLSFEMYPNPVSDVLNIQLPTGTEKAEVSVFDYTGRLVSSKTISSNDSTLDVQNISKGIYMIRVATNSKIGVQRFIKK